MGYIINEQTIRRMKHALGMDNKDPKDGVYHAYRRSVVFDSEDEDWEKLYKGGYAEKTVKGKECYYTVTREGMQAVADATKLTIRYTIECEPRTLILS